VTPGSRPGGVARQRRIALAPEPEETMIRQILKWLVLAPLAIVLIAFAVANRQWVNLSLDPFSSDPPALGISLPLFLVVLLVLILGVIVGGIAAWLGQRRWRKAARRLDAELRKSRAETEAWQRRAAAQEVASTALTPLYRPPPAA
jgi:uncharacterized integral membrane protein